MLTSLQKSNFIHAQFHHIFPVCLKILWSNHFILFHFCFYSDILSTGAHRILKCAFFRTHNEEDRLEFPICPISKQYDNPNETQPREIHWEFYLLPFYTYTCYVPEVNLSLYLLLQYSFLCEQFPYYLNLVFLILQEHHQDDFVLILSCQKYSCLRTKMCNS